MILSDDSLDSGKITPVDDGAEFTTDHVLPTHCARSMSVIVDFSVPADQFALGRLLEVRPGVQVRLESVIPTSDVMIPYFWVQSPDVEAVETTLQESPIVEDVMVVDQVEDETLFRVRWSEDINGIIESIRQSDAVILNGTGHGDDWSFELRFPEYESVSTFYRDVVNRGITIDLEGIHNPIESSDGIRLTPEQREALLTALDEGYFAVPREITMVELAEKLGISDSAVSQRIRRGLAKLLSATIVREPSNR